MLRIRTLQDVFYLNSAFDLALLSEQLQHEDGTGGTAGRTACVVGAVTCAVSFLECSINGLYEYAKQLSRPTKFHKALRDVWDEKADHLPMFSKYHIAIAFAGAEMFHRGSEPFQSADALVTLRNYIAHPKELMSGETSQEKLRKRLIRKFKFNPQGKLKGDFFPRECLSTDCAMWAVETAARFFLDFERRLPRKAYLLSSQGAASSLLSRAKASRRHAPLQMPRTS